MGVSRMRVLAVLTAMWIGMFPISSRALVLCVDHDGHISVEANCSPVSCSVAEACIDDDAAAHEEARATHTAESSHESHPCNDYPLASAVEGKVVPRTDGMPTYLAQAFSTAGIILPVDGVAVLPHRYGALSAYLAHPPHLASTIIRC